MICRYLKIIFQTENIIESVVVDIVQNVQTQSQYREFLGCESNHIILKHTWFQSPGLGADKKRQGSPHCSPDASIKTWFHRPSPTSLGASEQTVIQSLFLNDLYQLPSKGTVGSCYTREIQNKTFSDKTEQRLFKGKNPLQDPRDSNNWGQARWLRLLAERETSWVEQSYSLVGGKCINWSKTHHFLDLNSIKNSSHETLYRWHVERQSQQSLQHQNSAVNSPSDPL